MHWMESGMWLQVRRLMEDPSSILERNLYLRKVPLRNRSTVRLLQGAVGVSKTTIHAWSTKKNIASTHQFNQTHVEGCEQNGYGRLEFCLDKQGANGLYNAMYDRVHVDKKWFFLTWLTVRYYLVPDAEQPHQVIGHKCHIPKCMHLAANERPRWDAQHNQWFSGKLRLWPVAHQVAAKRNSRHIPAGTLEWKSLGLTKEVYGGFLFDKVVPSILQSRPRDNRRIQIQQDNATPPLSPAEFQTKWLE
jgi:hypothetical protein